MALLVPLPPDDFALKREIWRTGNVQFENAWKVENNSSGTSYDVLQAREKHIATDVVWRPKEQGKELNPRGSGDSVVSDHNTRVNLLAMQTNYKWRYLVKFNRPTLLIFPLAQGWSLQAEPERSLNNYCLSVRNWSFYFSFIYVGSYHIMVWHHLVWYAVSCYHAMLCYIYAILWYCIATQDHCLVGDRQQTTLRLNPRSGTPPQAPAVGYSWWEPRAIKGSLFLSLD